MCRFCGGKSCTVEDWTKSQCKYIKGLNSSLIFDHLVASQRPSTRLMQEFQIVKQFKDKDIGAIFNLQQPGEHALCADGIDEVTGFSYNPEDFMR